MRWTILLGAMTLAGCGLKAEHDYNSAKSNGATYRKLCALAEQVADTYDGSDAAKYAQWRQRAKSDCFMAENLPQ